MTIDTANASKSTHERVKEIITQVIPKSPEVIVECCML